MFEGFADAVQPHADIGLGQAEDLRHLGVGNAVEVEQDDRPVVGVEPSDAPRKDPAARKASSPFGVAAMASTSPRTTRSWRRVSLLRQLIAVLRQMR